MQAVIGLGIKVAWTQEELDRAQAAAHLSPAWFASREEAAARYLRISGLAGLLAADAPAVDAGLRQEHGRWRLAMDPGAFAVGAPDMAQLLARSRVPVILARGEHDAMNTSGQLARMGVQAVTSAFRRDARPSLLTGKPRPGARRVWERRCLPCIGDPGPRPAAGCAPEHLGEPAFRQRVAGLHAKPVRDHRRVIASAALKHLIVTLPAGGRRR